MDWIWIWTPYVHYEFQFKLVPPLRACFSTYLNARTLCKNWGIVHMRKNNYLRGHWACCKAHILRSSSTSISSSSIGLKYSATISVSACSRSGFSMKRTVPSLPRSPILPRALLPLARPPGVEGDAVLEGSLGEILVPLDALVAPFVMLLCSFHSVNRGRFLASIS